MRPVAFGDGPDGLELVDETTAPVAIADAEFGSATDGKSAPRIAIDRQPAGPLNEATAIS